LRRAHSGDGWWKAALVGFALALCAAPAHAQRDNPAYDEITETGGALADCAGAVAAQGGLNPVTHPHGGVQGQWPALLSAILTRLHVEPGLQGMTGRYAASAARTYWAARPRAARLAAANRCRDRFGG
jgi:hypothetical protein